MHRSSESMASLATALAKAQIELINPEKSLIANIRSDRRGELNQSFRYAPLSSGLDIIRKTLGRHEIAVMQTTAVDATSGMVNLTTLLAHTSGDWISSDWPVCPMSDTATPHRMGAALTYARRYALFTLVGIAGDDDLDAPDLNIGNASSLHSETSSGVAQTERSGLNGTANDSSCAIRTVKRPALTARQPILAPNESAALRAQLLAEIANLLSTEAITNWALGALVSKNKLTNTDAQVVETSFASRVAEINAGDSINCSTATPSSYLADPAPREPSPSEPSSKKVAKPQNKIVSPTNGIDKHALAIGAPPRRRDKGHLRYVATHACLVCGRQPSDPHHLRFSQPRALGRKVSDEFTVPLCRSHHRELHRARNEPTWWATFAIDPMAVAGRLWNDTHGASPHTHVIDTIKSRDRIEVVAPTVEKQQTPTNS